MGKSQKYLDNVAMTIAGQIGGIDPDSIGVHFNEEEFPMKFWSTYGKKIIGALKKFGPEAQGRIVSCERGHFEGSDICHWDMNEGRGLNSVCDAADQLLTLLTAYVVAAKLCLIVRDDLRASEKEEMQANHELSIAEAHGFGGMMMVVFDHPWY